MFKVLKELKVIKVKNEALDFFQLIEVCNGKKINGIDIINRERISGFRETVTLKKRKLSYEIQIRKDIEGDVSASLNSFIDAQGKKIYIDSGYKDITMEYVVGGESKVTFKDLKNNFNNSMIIEVKLDQFGQIKNTRIERTDVMVFPEIAGIGQDIIGKVLRKLGERSIAKEIEVARLGKELKC